MATRTIPSFTVQIIEKVVFNANLNIYNNSPFSRSAKGQGYSYILNTALAFQTGSFFKLRCIQSLITINIVLNIFFEGGLNQNCQNLNYVKTIFNQN